MIKKFILLLLALAALSCAMFAEVLPVLQVQPSGGLYIVNGEISAQPGQTVGWGFTLSSDTNYFVETLDTITITSGGAPGVFTDYLTHYLNSLLPVGGLVLGPNSAFEPQSVQQPFSGAAQSGIGGLAIDPAAPIPSQFTALLSIHYALFSTDPNDPVNFDPNSIVTYNGVELWDAVLEAPLTVNVVPEPASLLLLAPVAIWAVRRKKQ